MIDPVLILAPIAALPIAGLLRFIGCTPFSGVDNPVPITVPDPPDAVEGQAYSGKISPTGGVAPYTVAEQVFPADPWPSWLTLANDGTLTGTPPAIAGKIPLDILVTDSTKPKPLSPTFTIHLTVDPPPLAVSTASLPNGQLNVAYPATQLAFTGGVPAVSWSAAGLAPGLGVTATGQITGTPTKSGSFAVTITATDPKPEVATKALTLHVSAPFALFNSGVDPTAKVLADGAVDPHYRMTASADPAFPGPNAIVATSAPPASVPSGWVQGPASKWIAPQQNALLNNVVGDYKYTYSFDLTGFDPTTASITGSMWSDNASFYTLNAAPEQPIAQAPATFTIPIGAGFIAGKNTIVFRVNNSGAAPNPTGMRLELSGQAVSTV